MLKTIAAGARLSPLALLLNPTFWLAICIWTAFVAVYARDVGAESERLKQTELTAQALQQQADANERVLAAERKLRTDDARDFIKFREEQNHADQSHRQLVADLERDNRRLRVPVRRPVCPVAPDGGGAAGPDAGQEGHAELSADAGVFLVDLLARGDSAIRKHAVVVDLYERLRLACTAPTDQPTTTTTE